MACIWKKNMKVGQERNRKTEIRRKQLKVIGTHDTSVIVTATKAKAPRVKGYTLYGFVPGAGNDNTPIKHGTQYPDWSKTHR